MDVAEDLLEGLQSAFRGLSVEELDTQPVKRKREREKDAGDEADEGADQGQDPTNNPTFEGAPSACGLHASPSPITTTLPIPDPAAATSTPITNPPMAEDTGFTGMPTYPAYGMGPPTTAFPEATTASEPVISSCAPRWYAADYHHPLPATGAYVDVPGYATLSGLRRGPESLGGRSRGSGRSSNRSLTRSELNEVLRGATSKIVGDLTQEIRDKLEPLMIPPQASPTTVGVSPHRVQANHLVAGLTDTLGSLRSRKMPTPAAIPRSPFVPRTAQPPYSHVTNSTRAELDRLGLTALRAMVDVEPYGSSDLGGDPSDDEPPSMTSASPSEDDDPEDPENPSGKKKKKKRKTRRPEGRRSQEAKAIATSKIVVNLPEFIGKDLSEFAENFGRFIRLTGQTHASGRVKCDLLLQCCKTKYLGKQVRQIVTNSATFADVLVALERQYPTYETNLSIRAEIQNLAVLPNNPKPGRVSELLADLDHWAGRLTPGSYSSDDLLFWLVAELPRELWDECRSTAERKARSLRYEDLCVLLLELALEKESDQHLNNYRPGGGGSGGHGKGYQGSRPGRGTTPKDAHARIMENVKELFWCDATDEQGLGCSVLGRGAEPLVRTQFLEHPPTLNFGANHLKKWIQQPQKPPIPFLSPLNPHRRGGFWGGGQTVRAQLEQRRGELVFGVVSADPAGVVGEGLGEPTIRLPLPLTRSDPYLLDTNHEGVVGLLLPPPSPHPPPHPPPPPPLPPPPPPDPHRGSSSSPHPSRHGR